MDKKEALLSIIEEAKEKIISNSVCRLVTFRELSDKRHFNLLSFDQDLIMDNFVAIYDTSAFNNCKSGVLFTITGLYFDTSFNKIYFNYKDIKLINILPAKNKKDNSAHISISSIGFQAKILSSFFNKTPLKTLIEDIIKITENWDDDVISDTPSGIVELRNIKLDKETKIKCNAIIHTASVAAGGIGTGLAQIPLSDSIAIAPIQITMVISLGAVFGIRVTEGMAEGIISTLTAGFIGRGVSQVLVGWVPFLGNAINTATAAGITEAVGWIAVKHLQYLHKLDLQKGFHNGVEEGFRNASKIYEIKFSKQADSFLEHQKIHNNEREEFIKLINEYENFLVAIELNSSSYDVENKPHLQEMQDKLCKLKLLPIETDSTVEIIEEAEDPKEEKDAT